jgi:hypothetical protein
MKKTARSGSCSRIAFTTGASHEITVCVETWFSPRFPTIGSLNTS